MTGKNNLSRRRFLKEATGTVAGAVMLPYLVPASVLGGASASPSERITLGFIGAGKQSKHLMRSFLNSPGTQVVAACDVDKLKLARGKKIVEDHYAGKGGGTYKGCDTYGDFRDVIARDDIDAVVISTPDHWLDAIRKRSKPICDIETGCRSVSVCHLGNIAYKLQRPLRWDPGREVFVGDDDANRLLSRPMRSPWRM